MSSKLRVGVVFGGKSVEHEISIVSARSVMAAIDRERFDVIPIGVAKNGRWFSAADSMKLLNSERVDGDGFDLISVGSEKVRGPMTIEVDVIFPLVHGAYGEDGKLQGVLELADVPYVGSGPLSSALGMDKDLMKKLFSSNGIPVTAHKVIYWHDWSREKGALSNKVAGELRMPLFVKPANTGSSVGITKVKERASISAAIDEAFRYDNKVVIENGINAREIECSVLGNDDPEASVPGEVVPCNEFYDYRAKYIDDRSELVIPARLSPEQVHVVQDLSIRAFKALDCSGMARVDFLFDRDTGDPYVNELNTIPGFTPISMYPKLWEASGIPYGELISRLIDLALERHTKIARLETSYRSDRLQ